MLNTSTIDNIVKFFVEYTFAFLLLVTSKLFFILPTHCAVTSLMTHLDFLWDNKFGKEHET